MAHTVIGIFDYTNAAQSAVDYLQRNGFSRENIDITQREKTTETKSDDDDDFGEGISNFFSRLFGQSNDDARKYTEASKRGSMVTVYARTEEEAERAAKIMDEYGAVDVDERAAQYSHAENYGGTTRTEHSSHTDNPTKGTSTTEAKGVKKMPTMGVHPEISNPQHTHAENVGGTTANEKTIPVIKEELEVGKKVVEGGTTKLRSRIVEQPTEEHIRLRSERVNIERTPVDRPATAEDISNFKEGTIEVTEHKEVPVVNKDTRVVEEVSLNKDVEERDETIKDTVRKTEIDIDKDDTDQDKRRRSEDYDQDHGRDSNI